MTTENPKTAAEMMAYVTEKVQAELTRRPTKESIRDARKAVLDQADVAYDVQLAEVEKCGVDIGTMKMIVDFRYNKDLRVWEFTGLRVNSEVTLPQPVNLVSAKFHIDNAELAEIVVEAAKEVLEDDSQ